ncbi:MAG: hypothetical protein U0869_04770 [Chloroflexota bacterium]
MASTRSSVNTSEMTPVPSGVMVDTPPQTFRSTGQVTRPAGLGH